MKVLKCFGRHNACSISSGVIYYGACPTVLSEYSCCWLRFNFDRKLLTINVSVTKDFKIEVNLAKKQFCDMKIWFHLL